MENPQHGAGRARCPVDLGSPVTAHLFMPMAEPRTGELLKRVERQAVRNGIFTQTMVRPTMKIEL